MCDCRRILVKVLPHFNTFLFARALSARMCVCVCVCLCVCVCACLSVTLSLRTLTCKVHVKSCTQARGMLVEEEEGVRRRNCTQTRGMLEEEDSSWRRRRRRQYLRRGSLTIEQQV